MIFADELLPQAVETFRLTIMEGMGPRLRGDDEPQHSHPCKTIKLSRNVALDIRRIAQTHPIPPRLKPCLSRSAIPRNHLALLRIDQLDRHALCERHKIRDMPADRRLPDFVSFAKRVAIELVNAE